VGWGVVFHKKEDSRVKDALQRLVEHRRGQIRDARLVKVLDYAGEAVPEWLAGYGVGLGTIVPTRIPFYLLLVGSPERIPFEFGYLLSVEYGVGRLHFESPAGYTAYVESIVDYETGLCVPNGREVRFFGPEHPDDPATELSARSLVKPLAEGMQGGPSVLDRVAKRTHIVYQQKLHSPAESTKDMLHSIFHTPSSVSSPALLFTASHGVGWPLGDSRQASAQGALLCQDYPGGGFGPLRPEHYFTASDLLEDAHVYGMICFHFACYSAGTPQYDRFFHELGRPVQVAERSSFSALPKALLSHPNGAALGFIGHVERAWPSSIVTTAAEPQLLPFENTLGFILSGYPLGYSIKDFHERYATLSTNLASLLEKRDFDLVVQDSELVARWSERNDAESYVLFGDPGVQLRVSVLRG
jgi:hypothetical protein